MRLFAVVCVALLISLAVFRTRSASTEGTLRAAFPTIDAIESYDPANIMTARQANVIRNLYSRLVFIDDGGNIQPHLAKSFRVEGRTVSLTVRDNLKTTTGKPLSADDVVFTLKRLMVLNQNTHGDLQMFLCPNAKLVSMDADCEGLRQNGQTILLHTTTDAQARYLLPLISGPDFSIVPRGSVNSKLKIVDYRNTSGVYSVEIAEKSRIVLRANPYHFLYSEKIPQTVELLQLSGEEALQHYKAGKIDFITTIDTTPFSKMIETSEERGDTNLHRTIDIRLLMMQFTRRGLRDFPDRKQRLAIGAKLKNAAVEFIKKSKLSPSNEYFPLLGTGHLDEMRSEQIASMYKAAVLGDVKAGRVPRISFNVNAKANYEPFVIKAGFDPVTVASFPLELPIDQQPDAYITMTDSSVDESLSFVSYNIRVGAFGLSRQQGDVWMNKFMEITEKSERIEMLRDLHFNALANAIVVPIAFGPYTAIIRKPWEMNFPKTVAGTPLWLIRRP